MHNRGLFASFAVRCPQPENVAIWALGDILEYSSTAREAFCAFMRAMGVELPPGIGFETQSATDDEEHFQARPDVVGFDTAGRNVVIIECKFHACLTENQPLSYLKWLPDDRTGLLLFIAPEARVPHLWQELSSICQDHGLRFLQPSDLLQMNQHDYSGVLQHETSPTIHHILTVVSWRAVLSCLRDALQLAREPLAVAKVNDLDELCDTMDNAQWRPLHRVELSPDTGVRLTQFRYIIDEVVTKAVQAGLASQPRPVTSGAVWYGRSMQICGIECYLHFSALHWSSFQDNPDRATPLFLSLNGDRKLMRTIRHTLNNLEHSNIRKPLPMKDQEVTIPLSLSTGVGKEVVVRHLCGQIGDIAGTLESLSHTFNCLTH